MPPAIEVVHRFVATRFPEAPVVLLAGSTAQGTASPNSDVDLVLLFHLLPQGAWREVVRFEDHDFEVFAHDPATVVWFCREVERPSAMPVLATLIAEGITLRNTSPPMLDKVRALCSATLAAGPPPLDAAALDARRFAITDLSLAVAGPVTQARRLATASALYAALADFALRAHGRWSATGKAVPPALAALDPTLPARFTEAFTALIGQGDSAPAQQLVDFLLAPFGGRLREGFRQQAPANWRIDP